MLITRFFLQRGYSIPLLFIAFFSTNQLTAQYSAAKLVTELNGPKDFKSVDLDQDGDEDILATAFPSAGGLVWMENMDGLGNFGSPQSISTEINNINRISFGDVDNDGDNDIFFISGSTANNSSIGWIENLPGNSWSLVNIISTDLAEGNFVESVDLDNDGDLDIVGTSNDDNQVRWYENLDGQGNFSTPITITSSLNGPFSIDFADIDGDGDMDIFIPAYFSISIKYIENINNASEFELHNITGLGGNNPNAICAGDIDGDSDIDVVTGYFNNDEINIYYNDDIVNNEFTELVAGEEFFDKTLDVQLADIDLDGDLDITGVLQKNGVYSISWLENKDNGQDFSTENIVDPNFTLPFTNEDYRLLTQGDLNGDGKIDLIAGSFSGDEIVWFENEIVVPLSLNFSTNSPINCFGDANGFIQLNLTGGNEPYTIQWEDTNLSGDLVNDLTAGVYAVTVTDANGSIIETEITIEEPTLISTTLDAEICEGDDFNLNGNVFSQAGQYQVVLIASNDCDSLVNLNLDVLALPLVDLGDDLIIDLQESIILEIDDSFSAITWSDNSTASTFEFIAEDYGIGVHQISVEVIDNNGCTSSDTIEITVDMIDATNERSQELVSWNVYPNIIHNNEFYVDFDFSKYASKVDFKIISSKNQLIYEKACTSRLNWNSGELTLPLGVYFIVLSANGERFTSKIIVQ